MRRTFVFSPYQYLMFPPIGLPVGMMGMAAMAFAVCFTQSAADLPSMYIMLPFSLLLIAAAVVELCLSAPIYFALRQSGTEKWRALFPTPGTPCALKPSRDFADSIWALLVFFGIYGGCLAWAYFARSAKNAPVIPSLLALAVVFLAMVAVAWRLSSSWKWRRQGSPCLILPTQPIYIGRLFEGEIALSDSPSAGRSCQVTLCQKNELASAKTWTEAKSVTPVYGAENTLHIPFSFSLPTWTGPMDGAGIMWFLKAEMREAGEPLDVRFDNLPVFHPGPSAGDDQE